MVQTSLPEMGFVQGAEPLHMFHGSVMISLICFFIWNNVQLLPYGKATGAAGITPGEPKIPLRLCPFLNGPILKICLSKKSMDFAAASILTATTGAT